jgi:protein gp37
VGERTAIAWTDHTFNPWWGCERVSPGCQNCYAEAFAKRTGHDVWGKQSDRRFFGDKHWNQPLSWAAKADAEGVRRRVFCASMADVFEDRPELVEPRQRLFDLIAITEPLDWLLLTKRPENVARMVEAECWGAGVPWPANVCLGTTVEDQERANERVPTLLSIPAQVRFLSCEPLLGPITFRWAPWAPLCQEHSTGHLDGLKGIGWMICGGESGPKHRPLNLHHARQLRDQCVAAGVPFFFKQIGGRTPTAGGDALDGYVYKQFPASRVTA